MRERKKLMVWPEMELNGENGIGASNGGNRQDKNVWREQAELKANGGNRPSREKVRSRQSRRQNEECRLDKLQNGKNGHSREQIEGTDIERIKCWNRQSQYQLEGTDRTKKKWSEEGKAEHQWKNRTQQ